MLQGLHCRSRRLGAALAAVLTAASVPAQEAPAGTPRSPELEQAQAVFVRDIERQTASLRRIVGDEVLAWMELRAVAEEREDPETTGAIQAALSQVFFKRGLLVSRFEGERRIAGLYQDGRLTRYFPLAPADVAFLVNRGAAFVAFPRLVIQDSDPAIVIDVYDISKKGRKKVLNAVIPAAGARKFPITDFCRLELLPDMNFAVLDHALSNLGRQVGSGECWDLPATIIGERGGTVEGYRFGREVSWEDALPGDVLTHGTSGATGGHVMVLARWNKVQSSALILHQNVGGRRFVVRGVLGGRSSGDAGQPFAIWRP